MNWYQFAKASLIGLENLDHKTLKTLLPYLTETKTELQNELNNFAEDQFSYKKRMLVLGSINRALEKMENHLVKQGEKEADKYFSYGQQMAISEVDFAQKKLEKSPEPTDSLKDNQFLINNMESSLRTYTAGVRATITRALTNAVLAGRTGYEVTAKHTQHTTNHDQTHPCLLYTSPSPRD